MKRKITYRPSKASSILGGAVGAVFVFIGIFEAIPNFGIFGVFWTALAVVITTEEYEQKRKEILGQL